MDVVLGTMTFGQQVFEDESRGIIKEYIDYGYNRLDTAYVYNDGESEKLIGGFLKEFSRADLHIDTKANPRVTGKLDSKAIRIQIDGSLQRLGTDYVDCFYLHFPDKNVPVEEALETVNELHSEGKIREFGVSNYPSDLLDTVQNICRENDWICPTVYEGLYNPLSRRAEILQDSLDKYGMRFYAYNPLAGGLLTDKYSSYTESPESGRFTLRPNYQNRYWKKSYFDASAILKSECSKYGIDLSEAVFRWLVHSSMLTDKRNDAVIIGVSKERHLRSNVESLRKDLLPNDLITCFERAWEMCRDDSPEYFRFYGETNDKHQ